MAKTIEELEAEYWVSARIDRLLVLRESGVLSPETHCVCGAELMGATAKALAVCGDCMMGSPPLKPGPFSLLDERIAAAQSAKDHDPTSAWGAGATPGYEWPE